MAVGGLHALCGCIALCLFVLRAPTAHFTSPRVAGLETSNGWYWNDLGLRRLFASGRCEHCAPESLSERGTALLVSRNQVSSQKCHAACPVIQAGSSLRLSI